ncbi:MAG TPA: thioesterase family protein [Stellaceae bacterium]|jgi:acyl-CoA thioesterase FadM|nr:thioesterase family protein [Stellaceae bacterium]
MADWSETYRGTVPPWQCDVTEHFTIAYYFDRLEEAEANLAAELGLGEVLRAGGFTRRLDLRFARELRAGSSFHIASAPVGLENGLRIGHRFIDSFTDETVTWIDEHWELGGPGLPAIERDAIGRRLAAWDGPSAEARPEPKGTAGFIPTARGRVKPADLDAAGRFGLAAMVHRFTDSCIQAGAAIGMTAEWLHANRRGFSTFELALRITGELRLDDAYLVETGIAHLGNSSLRLVHRMTNPDSGREVATLGQYGVNLNLDARRPANLPDELRQRAAALVVPVA